MRPRSPENWVTAEAQPVPAWTLDVAAAGEALSTLGKAIGPGILDRQEDGGAGPCRNSKEGMQSSALNSSSRS